MPSRVMDLLKHFGTFLLYGIVFYVLFVCLRDAFKGNHATTNITVKPKEPKVAKKK